MTGHQKVGLTHAAQMARSWPLARPFWLRAMMLFAVIAATHPWLYAHSSFYWYLPGGLRFMLLVCAALALLAAIVGGELLGAFVMKVRLSFDAYRIFSGRSCPSRC